MVEITSDDAEYLIEFSAGGKARQRWLPDGDRRSVTSCG